MQFIVALPLLALLHNASPAQAVDTVLRRRATQQTINPYAPQLVACPSTPLIRPATNISTQEAQYITTRKTSRTNAALAAWLKHIDGSFNTSTLPMLGLAHSGGGYRATLNGAGIMQAMDSRDSNSSINGLYQAITYQSALSGGGGFLMSLAASNWSPVSTLQNTLYDERFPNGYLFPAEPNILYTGPNYLQIGKDVAAKQAAGYPTTIIDVYGRLLGYTLFNGSDGGVNLTMSGLTTLSNFVGHSVPFPIITSIGRNSSSNCAVGLNATQYEITPYEFGSWDNGTHAFVQTAYVGTNLTNGTAKGQECKTGLDNLGFVTGTTSDYFAGVCDPQQVPNGTFTPLVDALQALLVNAIGSAGDELFAAYPNPFFGSSHSAAVAQSQNLYLGDGGLSLQNDPIWPLIQPARNVSVLIVGDSEGNLTSEYPNDVPIAYTYVQAQAHKLAKMPFIPTAAVFRSQNLTQRAQFFGCNEPEAVTIVWLPFVAYIASASNVGSITTLQVSQDEVASVIANGNLIATQDNDKGWPLCLACAITKKTGASLPSGCAACFTKYCYAPTS